MKQYIVVHTHRFGSSVHLFRSTQTIVGGNDEVNKKLAKVLGIDFEPDSDEDLEISEILPSGENPVVSI